MAESMEEPVLDRTSRTTRGKRMTKLLDEEIEQDEQFWNQEALKEEEDDINYVEEGDAIDEFDSDFDEDEPDPDEEKENDPEDRVKTKKRLIFPGKTALKKKHIKKDLKKPERSLKDAKVEEVHESKQEESQEVPEELESERVVRKSTRTAVIVRQAEREAIREALQAITKPVKRKKEGEQKRMTQEEMLLDAAQTEIMNLRNLERVLAREEEVKKKATVHKAVYSGPQIRYSSRDGKSFLEFSKGAMFHSELGKSPVPWFAGDHCLCFLNPEKSLCVVTGMPAKYRDPKTGLPYATLDAFKVIRERFLKEESDRGKQQNMDMGPLSYLLLGKGFSSKHRRSRKVRKSDVRQGAWFHRVQTQESYLD